MPPPHPRAFAARLLAYLLAPRDGFFRIFSQVRIPAAVRRKIQRGTEAERLRHPFIDLAGQSMHFVVIVMDGKIVELLPAPYRALAAADKSGDRSDHSG